jgi:hypothetical protein
MVLRRMLIITWSDRIKNEVFQSAKEEITCKFLKNRHCLWIGHIVRHNELVS